MSASLAPLYSFFLSLPPFPPFLLPFFFPSLLSLFLSSSYKLHGNSILLFGLEPSFSTFMYWTLYGLVRKESKEKKVSIKQEHLGIEVTERICTLASGSFVSQEKHGSIKLYVWSFLKQYEGQLFFFHLLSLAPVNVLI